MADAKQMLLGAHTLRMSGRNFSTRKCWTLARDIPAFSRIAGARLASDGSIPGRSSRKFRHISALSFRIFRRFSCIFSLWFRRDRVEILCKRVFKDLIQKLSCPQMSPQIHVWELIKCAKLTACRICSKLSLNTFSWMRNEGNTLSGGITPKNRYMH